MDAEVALRLVAYFSLILMSGFFSGSETAMFSMGPVQLMRLEEENHPRAALLRSLVEQPRRLIATIFIGNEFVNIGASALMASVAHQQMRGYGSVMVALVSTIVSVSLILMLGEITPKNIAAKIDEKWALTASRPIAILAIVMAPLRIAIERIADLVVFIVGGREATSSATAEVGEEEFRTMVDVASRAGGVDPREKQLIENIFDIGDRRVREVMTPEPQIFMLSFEVPLPRILKLVQQNKYSRIPIYRKKRDTVVGLLYTKDLVGIRHGLRPQLPRLKELLHAPFFVPPNTKCETLMVEFRRRRTHLALVVDEYGKLIGLVTMEDLLEEVFGEIKDEKEIPPPTGEFPSVNPA
ncbi:MAG: HlyC/CorC family transporter [Deltaproteobacteria bacterium]|nr:HlyC/CorC family transporter [Deltaproteobacteria bacterium]